MRRLLLALSCLLLGEQALAAPISTYPPASALGGSEGMVGTQAGATVQITPDQIATYVGTGITTTGPYSGQVAQTLPAATQNACLNIFSYLTAAQQAAVQAHTSVVDFSPILTSAIATITTTWPTDNRYNGTNEICFPPGIYNFNSTVDIKHTVVIEGASGLDGGQTGSATTFLFPASTTGFIIDSYNTLGYNTVAGTTSGCASIIKNVAIGSHGGSPNPLIYGVWMRCRASLKDVTVFGFPGQDIDIVATAGGGGSVEGNDNEWSLENIFLHGQDLTSNNGIFYTINGLNIAGADANAGGSLRVTCQNLLGWCISDGSFLGNDHYKPSAAGTGGFSRVNFGGTSYFANPTTTSALLGSITPGTDATVWVPTSAASYPTWVGSPINTYFPGGDFYAPGSNTRTDFYGPYGEGGAPPSYVGPTSIAFGGLESNGFLGTGAAFINQNGAFFNYLGGFGSQGNYTASGTEAVSATVGSTFGAGCDVFSFTAATRWPSGWKLGCFTDGNLYETYNSIQYNIRTGPANTTINFGRTAAVLEGLGVTKFFLSDGTSSWNSARSITVGTALPSSTGRAVGEIVFNRTPALGGNAGWIETVQGSPDTWQPFGVVGGTAVLSGTTGNLGGGALTAGTCATGTVAVTNSTTAMAVIATPATYPGDAFTWNGYVSSAGTVTVRVCTNLATGGTPTASVYNVRVLQ